MFCPVCSNEVVDSSPICPNCGTELKPGETKETFMVRPTFIKWYEILNYLIHHIFYFAICMGLGYIVCVRLKISLLSLLLLFPVYLGIGYFKTSHLEKLYQGILFEFKNDCICYTNQYYPRLNGQIYYGDIARVVAYQNFLDYFFGLGHIKIKLTSNPRRGMLLKNMENPKIVYEKVKSYIEG